MFLTLDSSNTKNKKKEENDLNFDTMSHFFYYFPMNNYKNVIKKLKK